MRKTICFDIGNQNIKIGIFKNNIEPLNVIIEKKERSLNLLKKIIKKEEDYKIYGITVVPFLKDKIKRAFNVKFLEHKDYPEIKNPYEVPERLGIDRLANAYGALNIYKKNSIIIDFGTAITIDVVRKNGEFIGGIIIPSFKIMLDAINKNTQLINVKNVISDPPLIGRSTEECLSSGIINITIYGMKSVTKKIIKTYKLEDPLIILTGGGAPKLRKYYKNSIFDEFLTLKGIYLKSRNL